MEGFKFKRMTLSLFSLAHRFAGNGVMEAYAVFYEKEKIAPGVSFSSVEVNARLSNFCLFKSN
ncbi:hypothetical protein TURTL08_22830 [Turicimonas sp. TL08]